MEEDRRILLAQMAVDFLEEMPYSRLDDVEELLGDIDRRRNDRMLNVAVIGEFNTGKSTFINAFLTQDLLKTAWKATTAVPTNIYFPADGRLRIEAEGTDGKCYVLSDEEDRRQLENRLGSSLPAQQQEALAVLTTTNAWIDVLCRVNVHVPGTPLPENICLIDTPGVNPGAAGTEKHVETTQRVLRNYADAAIVLFPAQAVYTYSFQEFLRANAEHFMHEAVFVITMMDLVDEEERENVIEYARENLSAGFGIDSPVIYTCSAKYAHTSPKCREEDKHWQTEFGILREQILNRIHVNRPSILEESTEQLVRRILKELRMQAGRSRDDLENTMARINGISQEKMTHDPEGYDAALHSFRREKRRLEEQIRRTQYLCEVLSDTKTQRMKGEEA